MNGTYTQRRTTQRQNYGLGDLVRKIIPKEIAKVARVAAPFVAAVNPALAVPAAIAGGLGAYQQTGKLGRSLGEAGLTYGAGLASPGIGAWGKAGAASANLPGRAMAQKFLYGAPGTFSKTGAIRPGSGVFTKGAKGLLGAGGEFSLKKAWGKGMPGIFAVGTAGALALDKMVGPKKPGETMGSYMARRKKGMEEYLRYYYKNVNPLASEQEVQNFVDLNTEEYENKAQGGRIGKAFGDRPETLGPVTPGKGITAIDTGDFNLSDLGEYTQMYGPEGAGGMTLKEIVKMLVGRGTPLRAAIEMAKKMMMSAKTVGKSVNAGAPDITIGEDSGDIGIEDVMKAWPDTRKVTPLPRPIRDPHPDNNRLPPWTWPREVPPEMEQRLRELFKNRPQAAEGGRIGKYVGGMGLPGIPRMAPDGLEYDMSENGGFQPLGAQEGKDDVKANLAKNEFVFTADAVRGAGDGDIETGAQRMYDTMKRLENRVT